MVIRGASPMSRRWASCAVITAGLPIGWRSCVLGYPSGYAHGGEVNRMSVNADDDIEQAAWRIPVLLQIKGRLPT